MITHSQRAELGKIVCDKYMAIKPPNRVVHTNIFKTDEGEFKVICYPKSFVPTIDNLIKEYFSKLPQQIPKKRKRIHVTGNPIFSSRNMK